MPTESLFNAYKEEGAGRDGQGGGYQAEDIDPHVEGYDSRDVLTAAEIGQSRSSYAPTPREIDVPLRFLFNSAFLATVGRARSQLKNGWKSVLNKMKNSYVIPDDAESPNVVETLEGIFNGSNSLAKEYAAGMLYYKFAKYRVKRKMTHVGYHQLDISRGKMAHVISEAIPNVGPDVSGYDVDYVGYGKTGKSGPSYTSKRITTRDLTFYNEFQSSLCLSQIFGLLCESKDNPYLPSFEHITKNDAKAMMLYITNKLKGIQGNGPQTRNQEGAKKIFHIGIPNGVISSLNRAARRDTMDEARVEFLAENGYPAPADWGISHIKAIANIRTIYITISKVDMLNPQFKFTALHKIYDMSKYVFGDDCSHFQASNQNEDGFINAFNDTESLTTQINNMTLTEIRQKFAGLTALGIKKKDIDHLTPDPQLGTSQKKIIFDNHVADYFLKMYVRLMTGWDFREHTFQFQMFPFMGIATPFVFNAPSHSSAKSIFESPFIELLGKEEYDANKDQSEADLVLPNDAVEISRLTGYHKNSIFSATEQLEELALRPKIFDRVFSLLIDEQNDFPFNASLSDGVSEEDYEASLNPGSYLYKYFVTIRLGEGNFNILGDAGTTTEIPPPAENFEDKLNEWEDLLDDDFWDRYQAVEEGIAWKVNEWRENGLFRDRIDKIFNDHLGEIATKNVDIWTKQMTEQTGIGFFNYLRECTSVILEPWPDRPNDADDVANWFVNMQDAGIHITEITPKDFSQSGLPIAGLYNNAIDITGTQSYVDYNTYDVGMQNLTQDAALTKYASDIAAVATDVVAQIGMLSSHELYDSTALAGYATKFNGAMMGGDKAENMAPVLQAVWSNFGGEGLVAATQLGAQTTALASQPIATGYTTGMVEEVRTDTRIKT